MQNYYFLHICASRCAALLDKKYVFLLSNTLKMSIVCVAYEWKKVRHKYCLSLCVLMAEKWQDVIKHAKKLAYMQKM